MDIRRATRDELRRVDALLEGAGRRPLPPGFALSNLLVALEAGSVIGVVALDVVARRALCFGAVGASDHPPGEVLSSLMRSLVARAQELGLREIYAWDGDAREALATLGFTPAPADAVPNEIRSLRSFPEDPQQLSSLVHLELETRF